MPDSPSPSSSSQTSRPGAKTRRSSVFKELDIDIYTEDNLSLRSSALERPWKQVRFRSKPDIYELQNFDDGSSSIQAGPMSTRKPLRSIMVSNTLHELERPSTLTYSLSSIPRCYFLTLLIAVFLPLLHNSPLVANAGVPVVGVEGSIIRAREAYQGPIDGLHVDIAKRDNSPTDACTRFSHQTAIVNGTIYVYGGQATQKTGQSSNKWNNNFLALDITKQWEISSPALTGLAQPSGPPAVANAFLWNSYTSLFLYGGEYSDSPVALPAANSLWEYDISSSSWIQHKNPQTSAGTNSDEGGQPVQEAAEGAGVTVPGLGRGFYFGGHQDYLTTAGWSYETARIYLKSLVEFTFPGYTNDAVQTLGNGKTAGSDGVWRNITQGGLQSQDGFTERADGVLVYVPGFGPQGILLGLAGGTNATFTELNEIDVYDIASSVWYKQTTDGSAPSIRVDPCAVAASAADGSSINVYLFGGQNLLPANDQEQYNDMWILTIPSFTWIKVDQTGQSVPPPRAGHTCNIWDSQIIVVGGYVGNISCDDPGIYVFDASKLKWQNSFTPLSGGDALNQQSAQSQNSSGLSGSYGYQVPAAVQSVIGGQATGGATLTVPAVSATSGPLATGKPITYTVTGSNGATVTETGTASTTGGGSNPSNPPDNKKSGPNIAAIVAGVVAGCFALLAGYLGFCAWVYRRQLVLYKNHVAMAQRAAAEGGGPNEKTGFLYQKASENSSQTRVKRSTDGRSAAATSGTAASGVGSGTGSSGISSAPPLPGHGGVYPPVGGNSTANSSTEDLITGQEPSFVGVLLNPRRSLRVINRD